MSCESISPAKVKEGAAAMTIDITLNDEFGIISKTIWESALNEFGALGLPHWLWT